MSGSSVRALEPSSNCPKCKGPVVLRTARRGPNAGSELWGCSEFPGCRCIVAYEATVDAPVGKDAVVGTPADKDHGAAQEATTPDAGGKPRRFLTKVARTIDKDHRWHLERDEPDAAGGWDDDHRRSMLRYVYDRDGGRCGLCTAEMKIKGAQIEHVVPKVFVLFDVGKGGKAEPGTQHKRRLHKIDNLQAAHTYCNKRKGNTPEVDKWRHPAMPPLTVADTEDRGTLVLPRKPAARS